MHTSHESIGSIDSMREGLSLLMIAKNEEGVIGGSLNSFAPYVDEMIVADTGSTDRTKSVATESGARCISIPWEEDFSKAKNTLIPLASYRWILFADADETLKKSSAGDLQNIIELRETAAILIRFEDLTDEGGIRTYYLPRLFLNTPEIRYRNCVHETITASLERVTEAGVMGVIKSGITLIHRGYLHRELKRKGTTERNLLLLEKARRENPDDIFILLKYGDNLRLVGREGEAIEILYKAHALLKESGHPDGLFPELYSSLATLLIKRGELQEADTILKGFGETRGDVSLTYNLGVVLWKRGELQKAIDKYREAESLVSRGAEDPHGLLPFILNGIGEMCMAQKDLEGAESYFKRSHASASELLQPVFNLMRLSLERSHMETARHYLYQCELIAPDNRTVIEIKRAMG